jgi:GT2 family glycosyltransferase
MEEIDLCWRLQLEGRRVCTVPRSLVYHLGGGTLPNDSPWKLKLNYRNNLLMLSNNLAKTYALEYSGRHTPRKAASAACSRASRTIFLRMLLDCCSALVYLLGGKAGCFKAVIQAHREYRALVRRPGAEMVADYAASHPGVKAPKLYDRWIVPLALTKGNRIFAYLRNTL